MQESCDLEHLSLDEHEAAAHAVDCAASRQLQVGEAGPDGAMPHATAEWGVRHAERRDPAGIRSSQNHRSRNPCSRDPIEALLEMRHAIRRDDDVAVGEQDAVGASSERVTDPHVHPAREPEVPARLQVADPGPDALQRFSVAAG